MTLFRLTLPKLRERENESFSKCFILFFSKEREKVIMVSKTIDFWPYFAGNLDQHVLFWPRATAKLTDQRVGIVCWCDPGLSSQESNEI